VNTLLPLITLVVGIGINELLTRWRASRQRSVERSNRYDKFVSDTLAEALVAMDDAYEAASTIGLNVDKHSVVGGADVVPTGEHWAYREPFVAAVGKASMRLRRIAVLLPADQSPRTELETMAQAVADMTGQGTAKELLARFRIVDAAILPSREAIAAELRRLYAVPAGVIGARRTTPTLRVGSSEALRGASCGSTGARRGLTATRTTT
jgi:hypothetical protein